MDRVIERPPAAPDNGYGPRFDEDYLARVDRALHERKVRDPLRLDDIRRAANDELRANPFGALP